MSLGRALLRAPLSIHTGYGQDGLGIARSMNRLGYDVCIRPTQVDPPLPPEVAGLLCKPPEAPYDYFVHHVDPDQLGLVPPERQAAHLAIGWSMWEFQGCGDMKLKDSLTERLATYDVLFVYDEVSRQSVGAAAPDSVCVEKLQGGFWSEDWLQDPNQRDWDGTFRYAMAGMLNERKNPFAAIWAFKELKQELGSDFDAELHMKTAMPGLHPGMEESFPGVKIHAALWPHEKMKQLYLQTNLLLAPSWGEGKNLPALEAMSSGCPVAATNFGGHAEWLSDDWAYPLGYDLAEHAPDMLSARVHLDELKAAMLTAYNDRETCRKKGQLAAQVIPAMLDWQVVAERLKARLLALQG